MSTHLTILPFFVLLLLIFFSFPSFAVFALAIVLCLFAICMVFMYSSVRYRASSTQYNNTSKDRYVNGSKVNCYTCAHSERFSWQIGRKKQEKNEIKCLYIAYAAWSHISLVFFPLPFSSKCLPFGRNFISIIHFCFI